MNNPLIAGMLIHMDDSYNDMIDNILAPTCYGDVYGEKSAAVKMRWMRSQAALGQSSTWPTLEIVE